MSDEETVREALIDDLALMQAKARCHDSVFMSGRHNPLPTERQKARMFIEDHFDPLLAERDRLREASAEAYSWLTRRGTINEVTDALQAALAGVQR